MTRKELVERFGKSEEGRRKAIFSTLFLVGNRLETLFDRETPELPLKQFMLLTLVRQAAGAANLTELGELLGCSRQNIKKLAGQLERKGLVRVARSGDDPRAIVLLPQPALSAYFEEVAALHRQKLEALFGGYSEEELAQFFSLFMRLYPALERMEGGE